MNSKYEWDLTTIFKTQEDFEKAIDELYKECFYRKVHLILIETVYKNKRLEEQIPSK